MFLFDLADLLRFVNLWFCVSPYHLRLFFLFWIYLLHQFTEKLRVFMQHGSFRVFVGRIDFWTVWIFIERLPLSRVIVIDIRSCVFLIELSLIIGMGLRPEESFCDWIYWIGDFWAHELDRTVASEIVIMVGSERRDVGTSGRPASHRRKARWQLEIFPLETIRRMTGIGLDVGEIRVFPLNNKKITLNITVVLLLKFNNSYQICL